MNKYLLLFLALGFFVTSCEDDYEQKDREKIEAYLKANNIDAKEKSSGIFFISTKEGTGEHPTSNSTVKVKYKGYHLEDGSVFDQTDAGKTATFGLNGVIRGFKEGILLMKKGGKATIFIPSRLGYGSTPPPSIKKNAVIVFDVELIDF